MISTANYQGSVRLRSKSAFNTDVCKIAQAIYDASETIQEFCKFVVHNLNCTATFELTSPESRIVLAYPDTRLRLLHVRHNVTGEYLTHRIGTVLEKCPEVPLDQLETILSDEHLASLSDTEGYVIQFKDGDMVKIKCPWYVALHKSVTFVRERDIVELVLDERLDDTYEAFKQLGISESSIMAIESRVKNDLINIENAVRTIHEETKNKDRKEVALQWHTWPYFSLLMQMRDGKELRTTDYYRRNYLKQWPLTSVDNIGEKND
jgi:RNA ligase